MSHHFSVSRSRPVADKCSMSAWNEGFDSWGRTETEVIWLRQIWTPLMEADCWCLRWCWWNVLVPSLASSTVWCVQADAFTHTYTADTHSLPQPELWLNGLRPGPNCSLFWQIFVLKCLGLVWMIGWLVYWFIDVLIGRSVDWLIYWSIEWLTDWSIHCLFD